MSPEIALREESLSWRPVDGEVVVLDLAASKYLSVNESGSRLWEMLSRGSTRSELADELATSYKLDRASAERDVDSFLSSLASQGLLRGGPSQSEP